MRASHLERFDARLYSGARDAWIIASQLSLGKVSSLHTTRHGIQLREATPYGFAPKYLIRDNDSKFGSCFARVAKTSTIKILKTPVHAPQANAICERFMRSVRQECLDHLLILQEKQLQRVLNGYVAYFNQARPHQGTGQQIPELCRSGPSAQNAGDKVVARPVMGGLHHDYRWAA